MGQAGGEAEDVLHSSRKVQAGSAVPGLTPGTTQALLPEQESCFMLWFSLNEFKAWPPSRQSLGQVPAEQPPGAEHWSKERPTAGKSRGIQGGRFA